MTVAVLLHTYALQKQPSVKTLSSVTIAEVLAMFQNTLSCPNKRTNVAFAPVALITLGAPTSRSIRFSCKVPLFMIKAVRVTSGTRLARKGVEGFPLSTYRPANGWLLAEVGGS